MGLVQLSTVLALTYRTIWRESVPDHAPIAPVRPVPSGGALYPLEIYIIALATEGLPGGCYHYHPLLHTLEVLATRPILQDLVQCVVAVPPNACAVLCIAGVLPRVYFKYGELGYRLILLDAGHLAQNVMLVGQALGLGSLGCCGFYDDRMHDLLGIDGVDEFCIYLIWLGHPREGCADPPVDSYQ